MFFPTWYAVIASSILGLFSAPSIAGPIFADDKLAALEGVGITEHLDKQIPLDLTFFDDEGNEIYSLFGHIALRVKDKSTDEIYNWGMFEFSENQTEFGYNFAKGRLRYYMAIQKFDYFIYLFLFRYLRFT